ncbi:hypothetical protein D7216_06245 [Legionella pneumophila]|nr:hypothetical protein D7216_06245 [Legionella pneumophila]
MLHYAQHDVVLCALLKSAVCIFDFAPHFGLVPSLRWNDKSSIKTHLISTSIALFWFELCFVIWPKAP